MKLKHIILDKYFLYAFRFDFILAIFICLTYRFLTQNHKIESICKSQTIESFISDLLNVSISLAGFVLASLTIIITFKENISINQISQKGDENTSQKGLKIILSSRHYSVIVNTFSEAVFIYIIGFVVLAIYKFTYLNFPLFIGQYIIIISILFISLSIFRCIYLLQNIIYLQLIN